MNWRITEMEDELRCRNEGCALMGKPIRSPRTSYALAGTDVRRQRKYRKGPIFKKSRRPLVFLPTPPHLPSREGLLSLGDVDVASRRQLDRGTLYHALLTKLGWLHPNSNGRGQGETARRQTVRRAPQRDCVVAEGGPEPGVPAGVKREARRGRPRRG